MGPLTWTFRHIKGHQDDILDIDDIDEWGRMNIAADKIAKDHLQHVLHTTPIISYPQIPNALPPILYNYHNANTHVYSLASRTIKDLIAKDRCLHYWHTKKKRAVFHPSTDLQVFTHAASTTPIWQ